MSASLRASCFGMILAGCGATAEDTAADAASLVDARDAIAPDVRDVSAPDLTDASTPDRVDVVVLQDVPRDVARDAGAAADLPAPDASPEGPVLYPADRAHAPITAAVARSLREVAARANPQPRVFSKVGASNTVNTNFLHCFGGTSVDLGGRDALRPTMEHFRAGSAGGTDPYRRTSLAATVGWSAWAAVTGTPSPLQRELDAVDPRYAVVMFGTNDIQTRDLHRHGQSLLDIAELCAARGVIPLFTSVPPRDDDAEADRWVPRFTAVMRGVAQTAQMPFMDLERALRGLPGHGLGTDGIHMNAYPSGARACALTPDGLRYGFNVRNLLTLESLHRVRLVLEGGPAPEASGEVLRGEGTAEAPFEVPALPFADARDTRQSRSSRIDRYPGCMSAADEGGAEYLYRLTVREAFTLRALVLSRGDADIDVHALRGEVDGARCVARNDRMFTVAVTPGTWYVALDTFVSQGVPRAGRYVLVLMRD